MEFKQCIICGAPFMPKHDDQQCCAAECSRKKAGITDIRDRGDAEEDYAMDDDAALQEN